MNNALILVQLSILGKKYQDKTSYSELSLGYITYKLIQIIFILQS